MPSGKSDPGRRPRRLNEQGRTLARRRAQMRTRHPEVFADMVYLPDFGWVRVNSVFAIKDDRIVVPGSFPELVKDVEIFVRNLVAMVMGDFPSRPKLRAAFGR